MLISMLGPGGGGGGIIIIIIFNCTPLIGSKRGRKKKEKPVSLQGIFEVPDIPDLRYL